MILLEKIARSQAWESLLLSLGAIVASLAIFGVFLLFSGTDPLEVYSLMAYGSVGTAFSWQNTLLRAAPLLLAAFCTALPAKLGMIVIGGEGALVAGGVAAAVAGVALSGGSFFTAVAGMAAAAMIAGGLWIGLIGYLRHRKGVNETIVSLLMNYIAIALMNHLVEGPLRDPASLNKPSTHTIAGSHMIGAIPGTDVHYGVVVGVAVAMVMFFLFQFTTFGFSVKIIGGNKRAARIAGLPLGRIIFVTFFIGGALAGLAGMFEVAAVHGRANASLAVGYGYTAILVAFLARHNSLALVPVALLFGGIAASSGLVQRRLDLPDATMLVFQGIIFLTLLASESLRGRLVLKSSAAYG